MSAMNSASCGSSASGSAFAADGFFAFFASAAARATFFASRAFSGPLGAACTHTAATARA
jgi:hypothetical protein